MTHFGDSESGAGAGCGGEGQDCCDATSALGAQCTPDLDLTCDGSNTCIEPRAPSPPPLPAFDAGLLLRNVCQPRVAGSAVPGLTVPCSAMKLALICRRLPCRGAPGGFRSLACSSRRPEYLKR